MLIFTIAISFEIKAGKITKDKFVNIKDNEEYKSILVSSRTLMDNRQFYIKEFDSNYYYNFKAEYRFFKFIEYYVRTRIFDMRLFKENMETIRNTVDTDNLPGYKRLLTEEYSRKGLIDYDIKTLKSVFFNGMNLSSLKSSYCSNVEGELSKVAIEQVEEDMDDIIKHFNNLNAQLLDKMYKEKAEEIFKCIPMKMESFYEKFDRECMNIPIFKYYDVYQLFQRISCASNEDIVLIKEKLIKRAEKYTKEIEPEMKNIKQLKQVIDDYLKGKDQSIKIVMLREFSNSLGYILDKYKMSFLPKKEEI